MEITVTQAPPLESLTIEPTPTAAPDPESVKRQARDAYQKLFGQEMPAEMEPQVAQTPLFVPPEPVVVAPAAAPVVAPEPEPEPAERSRLTSTAIREAVRQGVREAVTMAEPTPATPVLPKVDLTPEDESDYRALTYLAKSDVAFKDWPAKYLDFCKRVYAYQEKWATENPEGEFNWDEEEHSKWYDQHQPKGMPDRERLIEAKAEMRAEEKWQQKMQPEIDRQNSERAYAEARPKINSQVERLVVTMVDQVDPELGKMLRDEQGRPRLNDENAKKVDAKNPIAYAVLDHLAADTALICEELEKLSVPDMKYQLDPANNAVHAEIHRYHMEAERDILNAAPEDQIFSGKQFTSVADMQALRREIEQSNQTEPQKRRAHAELEATRCTLQIDELEQIIIADRAARAKAMIARQTALAKKMYGNGNGAPANGQPTVVPTPQPTNAPSPSIAAPAAPSARPPSLSSGADVVTSGKPSGGTPQTEVEQITTTLFGR